MDDRDTVFAAPFRKRPQLTKRVRPLEAPDGKLGGGHDGVGRALHPGPAGLEAREVDLPSIRVEAADEFNHLPFGSPRFEPGHDERDRYGSWH